MPNENSIIQTLKEIMNIILEYLFKKYTKKATLSFILFLITILLICLPLPSFLNIFTGFLFFASLTLFVYFKIKQERLEEFKKSKLQQKNNKTENSSLNEIAENNENTEVVKKVLTLLKVYTKEENTETFSEKLFLKEKEKQKDLFNPNNPSYKV